MAGIKIRDARSEDASDIVRLIQELAADDGVQSPINEAYARYYLSQPHYHALLAEADGLVMGLLAYMMKADLFHGGETCYISELIVTDGQRDRGIGSALMQALFHRLEEDGCVEVSVSTMPNNRGAIAFYRRHGMVDEAVFLEKHFKS